jgi:hypothetical protein
VRHGKLARGGFTVVETLVALTLGWLVAYLALTTLARQRGLQTRLTQRAEALAAARVTRVLLGEEARVGAPIRDGWSASGESLSLRAFRGIAVPCAPVSASEELAVRVRGVRRPDPQKDSVLVVDFTGSGPVRAILDRRAASDVDCGGPDAGTLERWRLSGTLPPGALVLRYFERGSYHLSAHALRYRRGQAGRQPLTPEVLSDALSGFRPGVPTPSVRLGTTAPGAVEVRWPGVRLRASEEPDER